MYRETEISHEYGISDANRTMYKQMKHEI